MTARNTKSKVEAPEVETPDVSSFADPTREFASVVIELADLTSAEGKAFVKMAMGSDTAGEAVLSMHARYGLPVSVDTCLLIGQSTDVAALFLMHTPAPHPSQPHRSFAIIDRAYWDEIKANPLGGNGTDQETVGVFVTLANEAERQAKQAGKGLYEVRGVLSE